MMRKITIIKEIRIMADNKDVMEALVKEKQALTEAIGELDAQLNKYKELGTPEEIDDALTKAKDVIDKVKKFNLSTVEEDMAELARYRELGNVDQIDEATEKSIELIGTYSKLGKPEEIDALLEKATSLLEQYSVLGKPKEIEKIIDDYTEKEIVGRCEELGAKYNTDTSLVRKMYDKVNCFETVDELMNASFNRKSQKEENKENSKKSESKETLTIETKGKKAYNLSQIVKSLS